METQNTADSLISFENMGTPNKNKVSIGTLSLWFSYKTIVAFSDSRTGLKVCANVWGKTTGKLLNELEQDKSKRLNLMQFKQELHECLKQHYLQECLKQQTPSLI